VASANGTQPRPRPARRNGLARLEHRVEAVEKADVLVGHEDVHESAQGPRSSRTERQFRIGGVHGEDGFTHGDGLDRYFTGSPDEGA